MFATCKIIAQQKLYTPFAERLNKIEKLKAEGNKVTEISPNIFKIKDKGGKTIYKNIGNYIPTAKELLKSATFDSTIIDLTTIDTSLYSYKYKFWQEVPIGSLDYEPIIGDINNNGLPEIYGSQYNADTGRIAVMEMNSEGKFSLKYTYDSEQVAKSIYDINKDGGKELLLGINHPSDAQYLPGNSYSFYIKQSETSLAAQLSFVFHKFGGQMENSYFGDWDGDDYTDWIFVDLFALPSNTINIYEFNPLNNYFDSVYSYDLGNDAYGGFAIGDFDQDGKTEFLGGGVHGDVVAIENNGNNVYKATWKDKVETYNAYFATQTNDLDENGKKEIWIMGDAFYNGIPKTRITIFESDRNDSYVAVGKIDLIGVFSFDAGNMQTLDVDKDGKDEVMICIDGNVIIFKFAGSKDHQKYKIFYIKQTRLPGIVYYGATMYDLNNDGKEEIIVSMENIGDTNYKLFSDIYKPDSTIDAIKEKPNTPENYLLYQNYPNPFNPTTTIKFSIPKRSFVSIKVYNILGKEINTLAEKEFSPGTYSVSWDVGGVESSLPSGVYLIKLSAKGNSNRYTKTIKALLLK